MCYRPLYLRGRVCVLRICNHPMPVASLASTAIAISAPALAFTAPSLSHAISAPALALAPAALKSDLRQYVHLSLRLPLRRRRPRL